MEEDEGKESRKWGLPNNSLVVSRVAVVHVKELLSEHMLIHHSSMSLMKIPPCKFLCNKVSYIR